MVGRLVFWSADVEVGLEGRMDDRMLTGIVLLGLSTLFGSYGILTLATLLHRGRARRDVDTVRPTQPVI
jgi:hypothetical protein